MFPLKHENFFVENFLWKTFCGKLFCGKLFCGKPNEVIEADDETLPYAEEDWQDPEQREVSKNLEPDLPFTIQTRQNDRTKQEKI